MKNSTRSYPRVHVDTARSGAVAQAGGVLLTRAAEGTGLTASLKTELSTWRKPSAVHEPGKVLSDLALSLALGVDCLADLALLRSEPGVYGNVASEATVSRALSALAGDAGSAGQGDQQGPRDCSGTDLGAGRWGRARPWRDRGHSADRRHRRPRS